MANELKHYGTPRHSGRYPWGSGDDPQQRNKSFLGYVDDLKKKGLSEKEIANGLGLTINQLRAKKSRANDEQWIADSAEARRLKDKGYSNVEIGKRMGGKNESSIRALLDPTLRARREVTNSTADMLKDSIDNKGYIDIGVGVERHIGISRTKLKTAVDQLKDEGYLVTYIPVEQLGTGKKTSVMVLSKPKNDDAIEVVKLKNGGLSETDISKKLGLTEESVTSLLKGAYAEVYANKDNVKMITDYSEDGGRSFLGLEPIRSVDSNRIQIRYAEEGGKDKDGLIELRQGVDDISLGNAKYAQVRIGVDGTHYMKGMAVYSDDIPKGVDIIYNTNKSVGTPKKKVFKEMKTDKDGNIDPDNPFGASVRQKHFITKEGLKVKGSAEMLDMKTKGFSYKEIAEAMKISEDTVRKAISVKALNIVNEEGEWGEKWSKSLSSQMLSKQRPALAEKQLKLAFDIKKEEFDELVSLNNPIVKKKLLDSFGDDCDSAAVHLKAAALPRSGWHAILPFPSMKETEIYAPNYRDGEQVVLIRYPHGGIFEIPELTVNNRHPEVSKVMKQAKDAVGINAKVAEQLTGADFDGDTVLVIPNNNRQIKTGSRLKDLKDFDTKTSYAPYDGMTTIDGGIYNASTGKVVYGPKGPNTKTKQMKMGDVSNLITDMTIRGANTDEIARAVKHSMVVIDSEKHHLDYKRSYTENGIAQLKKKYQGSERSGASTLISKASSDSRPLHRVEGMKVVDPVTGKTKRLYVDPATGKKLYEYTGETYTKYVKRADGTIKPVTMRRTVKSTKMAEVEDAFKLSSGTPIETVYASHANKLKALGNEARKISVNTKPPETSDSAKKAYAHEVASLNSKLNIALKNAPLEKQAQVLANSIVSAKRQDNPNMDASDLKKIKGQALAEARSRTHAKKTLVDITDREWEAIQAGAVSNTTLTKILNNTDLDRVKQLATPRTTSTLTPAKQQRVKSMLASGYSQADIADALGVSVSAITNLMN